MNDPAVSILSSVLPFVLLLAIWAVLLVWLRGNSKRAKKTARESYIDPMREMLQIEIVPEIRALRESVEALRAQVKASDDNASDRWIK